MNVQVKFKNKRLVNIVEMKDGDIGVIRKWDLHTKYLGRVVQKAENDIISIGMRRDESWWDFMNLFDSKSFSLKPNNFMIEILQAGDTIEIKD